MFSRLKEMKLSFANVQRAAVVPDLTLMIPANASAAIQSNALTWRAQEHISVIAVAPAPAIRFPSLPVSANAA